MVYGGNWRRTDLLIMSTTLTMAGIVTFSRALTLRFVTFNASSIAKNEVCRDASRINAFKYSENFSRHCEIFRPPPVNPRLSLLRSAPVSQLMKTGSFTPAILSVRLDTRTAAVIWLSRTLFRKFPNESCRNNKARKSTFLKERIGLPAAYSACVRLKKTDDAKSPMPTLVS